MSHDIKLKEWVVPDYHGPRSFKHAQTQFIHARQVFYDIVAREKPESILDVGCGEGPDAGPISKLGVRYAGFDAIEENLTVARRDNPGLEFKQGFCQQIPYPDKSFDWCWCTGVWEILPKPEDMDKAMKEMLRVARKKIFNLDTNPQPRFMGERYQSIPQELGLSITRIHYNSEKKKADYLWEISLE